MPGERCGRHGRARRARGVGRAVERARKDKTPTLLEVRTYRFRGHSMRDPAGAVYRTKDEVEERRSAIRSCCSASGSCSRTGRWTRPTSRRSRRTSRRLVDEAVAFADASPEPPLAKTLFTDIYKDVPMAVMTYREALNQALREEMRATTPRLPHGRGGRAVYQGAYKVTQGLLKEFGESASSTRRSPSRASPASASARRWSACGRSSSS